MLTFHSKRPNPYDGINLFVFPWANNNMLFGLVCSYESNKATILMTRIWISTQAISSVWLRLRDQIICKEGCFQEILEPVTEGCIGACCHTNEIKLHVYRLDDSGLMFCFWVYSAGNHIHGPLQSNIITTWSRISLMIWAQAASTDCKSPFAPCVSSFFPSDLLLQSRTLILTYYMDLRA